MEPGRLGTDFLSILQEILRMCFNILLLVAHQMNEMSNKMFQTGN